MKFEDYELIHKTDLLILKDQIKDLERKNRDLMDLVDVKRLWLIDKAEKRLSDILRVGHQLVDRSGCTCVSSSFKCHKCHELAIKWKEVAGDPKE